MAATLLQLRDQIIIDANLQGNSLFPSPRLNRLINLAQRRVQTELNGLGMKKWEASDSLTMSTAANFLGITTSISSLATDCPNMLESPNSIILIATVDADDVKGIAKEVDIKSFEEQFKNTYLVPTASQPVFFRLANSIYIYPPMTTATAYYYKAVTDLSSDAATTEIPIEFEEYIMRYAIAEINGILGNLDKKIAQEQKATQDLMTAYEKFIGKQNENFRIKNNNKAALQ